MVAIIQNKKINMKITCQGKARQNKQRRQRTILKTTGKGTSNTFKVWRLRTKYFKTK